MAVFLSCNKSIVLASCQKYSLAVCVVPVIFNSLTIDGLENRITEFSSPHFHSGANESRGTDHSFGEKFHLLEFVV